MMSMIYQGFVEHYRLQPVKNGFRYPVYGYGLDLDELTILDKTLPLFGYNRFRPVSIHDRDYLEPGEGSIKEKLLRLLSREQVTDRIDRVLMVTSARYFNYVFNPVSFFYCLNASGGVEVVVVEVNNTFGERHIYIPRRESGPSASHSGIRYVADKEFHVSPFNDMQGTYEFFFPNPLESLDVRINLKKDGELIFWARLRGTDQRKLDFLNLLKTIFKKPIAPHQTTPRIFYQAAKLFFIKKMPYLKKPEPHSPMTIVHGKGSRSP